MLENLPKEIYQLTNIFTSIIEAVQSPVFLFYLKMVLLSISSLLAVGIIYFLWRNNWLRNRYLEDIVEVSNYRPYGVKKSFKQWAVIVKKLDSNKGEDYKMAIIEADNLLKEVLQKMNYKGETTAELLEKIDDKILPNLDKIKSAHSVRNNVVHDPDFDLTQTGAKQIMVVYEQAFRDLQMF